MPLNQIESYLYGPDLIGHAVDEKSGSMILTIAPWPYTTDPDADLGRKKVAVFNNAVITSREILELGNEKYEIILNWDEIEIIYEACWPKLQS